MEHIPQRISTTGNINSAPKMFAVFVSMTQLLCGKLDED
jgi:hypothetical protein